MRGRHSTRYHALNLCSGCKAYHERPAGESALKLVTKHIPVGAVAPAQMNHMQRTVRCAVSTVPYSQTLGVDTNVSISAEAPADREIICSAVQSLLCSQPAPGDRAPAQRKKPQAVDSVLRSQHSAIQSDPGRGHTRPSQPHA